jgi:hypothetical protein
MEEIDTLSSGAMPTLTDDPRDIVLTQRYRKSEVELMERDRAQSGAATLSDHIRANALGRPQPVEVRRFDLQRAWSELIKLSGRVAALEIEPKKEQKAVLKSCERAVDALTDLILKTESTTKNEG